MDKQSIFIKGTDGQAKYIYKSQPRSGQLYAFLKLCLRKVLIFFSDLQWLTRVNFLLEKIYLKHIFCEAI